MCFVGHIRDEKLSMQGGNALQRYDSIAHSAEHATFNRKVEGA